MRSTRERVTFEPVKSEWLWTMEGQRYLDPPESVRPGQAGTMIAVSPRLKTTAQVERSLHRAALRGLRKWLANRKADGLPVPGFPLHLTGAEAAYLAVTSFWGANRCPILR